MTKKEYITKYNDKNNKDVEDWCVLHESAFSGVVLCQFDWEEEKLFGYRYRPNGDSEVKDFFYVKARLTKDGGTKFTLGGTTYNLDDFCNVN